jgi:hypothetical protein
VEEALRVVASLGLLAVLAGAAWGIPKLHRHSGASGWLRAGTVILALGLGIGLCFVRYMPQPDAVAWGLPLPLVTFKREQYGWVDYVGSPMAMLLAAAVNVLFTSGVVHWLAYLFVRRRAAVAHRAP